MFKLVRQFIMRKEDSLIYHLQIQNQAYSSSHGNNQKDSKVRTQEEKDSRVRTKEDAVKLILDILYSYFSPILKRVGRGFAAIPRDSWFPLAIFAVFLALARAAWSLDMPNILYFNLLNIIYWFSFYLSIYYYDRTEEWIQSKLFNIIFFIFIFLIYAAICNIPLPSITVKLKVILILGGSAALYYIGLASTPLEKIVCLDLLFFSTISAMVLWNMAGPTEIFISIFLFITSILVIPLDLIFCVLILVRCILFPDYGPALLMQTFCVYGLIKFRKKSILLGSIYITILFTYGMGLSMVKGVLFPLSGALAFFFFFIAAGGKEHTITALFYLINQQYLCLITKNKEVSIYIFSIFAGFFIIFLIITLLKSINDRYNERKVSKWKEDFLFLLEEGKLKFFLVIFSPIFLLCPVSGAQQWVHALAETMFLQVVFLNILIFIFKNFLNLRSSEMIEKRTM